jgi:hypothetical protein
VSGDAGFTANATLQCIEKKGWMYMFAMARNRKFTNGKYVSDLMRHLPKGCYSRRAIHKPDGRRCDYCLHLGGSKPPPLGGSFSIFAINLGA